LGSDHRHFDDLLGIEQAREFLKNLIIDLSFAAYGLVKISKQRAFPFVEQSAVLPLRERIELRLRIAAGEGGWHMLMYLVVAPHELCGPQYGYFAYRTRHHRFVTNGRYNGRARPGQFRT